jgi:hypothetical protein
MKTVGVFLLLALTSLACLATEIRVRNDSDIVLMNVVVGGRNYGDIPPHATTGYQTWDLAYQRATVALVANSNPIIFQPHNYVREGELGRGKYTYVLDFKGGVIRINAEKDED